jgi:sterol desaturase/sphingolipid hydroxylase (fatty acid hydroxylase superfamily)
MTDILRVNWPATYFVLMWSSVATALLLETKWPRSPLHTSLRARWWANGCFLVLDNLILRALLPTSVAAAAWFAASRGWGLFNLVEVPPALAFVVAWLVIDLASYVLHRLQHRYAWLWRVHRIHHSDPDVDVTTGFRFHPIEALLQVAVTAGATLAIGAPPVAAVLFLFLQIVVSMFSHANVCLPGWLDTALRWVVITPAMHRSHHSALRDDYDSNFCTLMSCWDRVFGTYRAKPADEFDTMVFGVEGRSPADATSVARLLADPFLPNLASATSATTRAVHDLSD